MFKFEPLKIGKKYPSAKDLWLSLQILKLAYVWRRNIFDDFAFQKHGNFYELVKSLTNSFFPYFWAVLDHKDDFLGFVYLYDLMGAVGETPYSACVSACLRRKFWGNDAKLAGREFLKFCAQLRIKRLKAQCFSNNPCAKRLLGDLGFKCEGILKKEAIVGGKAVDLTAFGCFLKEYER